MLKLRIITASALLPLLLLPVLLGTHEMVMILFASMVGVAGWEWSALSGVQSRLIRCCYIAVLLIGISTLFLASNQLPFLSIVIYSLAVCGWLIIALFVLKRYRPDVTYTFSKTVQVRKLVTGFIVLLSSWIALTELNLAGVAYLIYVFGIVWVADIGAYFVGKRLGKRKLALYISPGKTWEGFFGGLLMVGIWSLLGVWYFDITMQFAFWFVSLSLMAGLFSVVGDLYESLLKRQVGVKDSGWILPGHGGILDRIDSLLAAAPIFILGLHLLKLTGFAQ